MQRVGLHDLVQAEYPGQPGEYDGVVQGQRSDVFLTLKPRAGWGLPDVPLPLEPSAAQGLGLMLSLLHLGCQTEGGLQGRDTREPGLWRKLLPRSILTCDGHWPLTCPAQGWSSEAPCPGIGPGPQNCADGQRTGSRLPPPSPSQPSGFSLDPWKPDQGTAGAEVMTVVSELRRECLEFMHVFPLLQEGHFRLRAPPLLCRRVDVPSNKGAILSQTLN